ncbi:MAG: tRNA preQ1(34) S-adenosylmethionine ribosyltransferase-isomerase QueA [Verrucomicrobiota bacterium]
MASSSEQGLRTSDFDYLLPSELIASRPLADRSASRMMVVDRARGTISHGQFRDFSESLGEGSLCVFNDTRVVPARFFSDEGKVELLKLEAAEPCLWRCLVKPGKRMKVGRKIALGGVEGVVEAVLENGDRLIRWQSSIEEDRYGQLALPHYMEREMEPEDRERYQTVYAAKEGAVAAPTAGLHFTPEMMETLPHVFVTLHVGVGTFRPVKAEKVADHEMHAERFHLSEETARRINEARRVVAIGTTTVRVLESQADPAGSLQSGSGETSVFLFPPYDFRCVDSLLTNFHLPQSTLLMLVSALAGRELILEAYAKAVEERYRFFSYGDCMLIL